MRSKSDYKTSQKLQTKDSASLGIIVSCFSSFCSSVRKETDAQVPSSQTPHDLTRGKVLVVLEFRVMFRRVDHNRSSCSCIGFSNPLDAFGEGPRASVAERRQVVLFVFLCVDWSIS